MRCSNVKFARAVKVALAQKLRLDSCLAMLPDDVRIAYQPLIDDPVTAAAARRTAIERSLVRSTVQEAEVSENFKQRL